MKFTIRLEWLPLSLIAIPYIYLIFVWGHMPERLPLHWNAYDEIDNWGSKYIAWLLPLILPGGFYLLMWLLLWADPKQKLQQMGKKFHQLKLVLVAAFSALVLLIFYYAQKNELKDGSTWFLLFQGILFAALGNFFQTLRPNYFIGIRSPWTLESEEVWRKTHKVFGWVWIIGGLIMIVFPFVLPLKMAQHISGIFTLVILAGLPYLYSFLIWKWPDKFKLSKKKTVANLNHQSKH